MNNKNEGYTKIAIVMGSDSDWSVMQKCAETLEQFNVSYLAKVISAHRTPDLMFEFANTAKDNGFEIIIAGAGGSAHLPGMIASKTTLPVLGVPIPSQHLNGQDSLYSIVQMPRGIPVATFAIGVAGAVNSALFALSCLALNDEDLAQALKKFRQKQTEKVLAMKLEN